MTRSAMSGRRTAIVVVAAAGLVATLVPPAVPAVLGGLNDGTLRREPLKTPESLTDGLLKGLQFADPQAQLAGVAPPEANSGGNAQLSYPLVIPGGRGLTPRVTLEYDSAGTGSWVGNGWDLTAGDISVDTTFGVPLFCPRATAPTCGNFESETYRLDGEVLAPTAARTDLQARVAERADFTRKVETRYDHIIRHGDSPKNYFWEVRDKMGNINWYGGYPDEGGPFGAPGTRTGVARNDRTEAPSSILTDAHGNRVRWYLKATRDVGVNMVRYEYDTVYYKAVDTTEGVGWQKVTAETCSGVCGKHVYLSKILYTGGAEASGQDEAPPYEISFLRERQRPDPRIDGRGGVLDVDIEQLTRVVVDFTPPGGPREKVVEYQLDTATGLFGKTKLTAVHQIGCATGSACSPDTRSTHQFSYYDDVDGKGFEDPATWDTGNDDLGSGRLEGKAGALGMSDSNAGDGHVYVGFNPFTGTKLGSFGGSLTFEGSERDSLSEFMDINGDGLRDKVFRSGGGVKYRLNTSKPSDALNAEVSFEAAARTVSGLSRLPGERDFGVAGGVEAFFGVSAMFTAGGSWSWSKGYFADVNADGLPDWVEGASVRYNRLDCQSEPGVCRPTFDDGHGQTRVPLNVRDVGAAGDDEELQEALGLLRRLSPPIDTVRRWTAPYAGTVRIESTARLDGDAAPDCSATTGVVVAVQHNGSELGRCTLSGAGQAWAFNQSRAVAKGDRLYFRLAPHPDLPASQVQWHPRITYTSFSIGTDANGLSQNVFDSDDDFTLAGRPNAFVSMPEGGTVRYTGVVDKAVTSDWVRPTIRHYRGSAPTTLVDQHVEVTAVNADGDPEPARQKSVVQRGAQWCVEYPNGTRFACLSTQSAATAHLRYLFPRETGRFRTTSQFAVAAPVTGADGAQTATDRVEFLLAADSNIAATALRWVKQVELCYLDGDSCRGGAVNINPPVDTEVYPLMSAAGPRAGWDPPGSSTRTVRVQVDVTGLFSSVPADTMWVTVKGSDGSVVRHSIDIPANGFGHIDRTFSVPFQDDVRYWFDAHVRQPTLFEVLRDGFFQVSDGTDSNGNTIWAGLGAHGSFNSPGRQGYFGLGYRGWAMAGYLGNGDRRTTPLHEADLNLPTFDSAGDACQALTGGPCRTSNDGLDFPGAYPDDYGPSGPDFDPGGVESQFEKTYAFVPKRSTNAVTGAVRELWEGPRDTINGTATTASAARLGGPVPSDASGIGTLAPPVLKGQVSPSLALTAGVGPLTASGGVGWTDGDVDYLDMNGDSFPDVVQSGSIQFTDPRGGHACLQEGGGLAACDGGGVGAVNEALTVAAGGGLGGSPVGFSSDTKGNTNGNGGGGSSVRKGGPVSKDQYGASVGAGVEIGASWTSPVAKAPGWDEPGHGVPPGFDPAKFSEIPGDPMGGAGTELGRMLADVNGDGLPDQVRTNAEGVYARLNLGYGFAPDWVLWAPDSGFESAESYTGSVAVGVGFAGYFKDFSGGVSRSAAVSFPRYTWRDVNGDGILDALYKSDDEVRVAFGTGSGLTPGQKYGDTGEVEFSVVGELGVKLKDQVRQQSSVGWGGGADFTIGIGPLCLVGCYIIVNPGGHFEAGLTRTDIELQDVNGDGYADSVNRLSDGGHQEKLQVRLNRQGRTGLLQSVKNPLGGTMTLDYERKGNSLDHPASLWVMKSLTVDDGRRGDGPDTTRTTFDYDGLRYDFVNRQGLGFSTVTTRELGSSGPLRTTRETFRNASVFESGLQDRAELFDGDASADDLLQRSIAEWQVLDGPTQQPLGAGGLSPDASLKAWATPLLTGLRHEWYVKGEASPKQETATTYLYGDRMGNPTRITDLGDPDIDADDVIADVVYSTCDVAASADLAALCGPAAGDASLHPPFWTDQRCPTWTSLPAVITVKDHAGKVLRHRDGRQDLCDNSSVTLLRELISGGVADGEYAETELAYDDWGSYDRIIYPLGENGRHYAVHYEYDPDRHSDVGQVTEYDLHPAEKARFLDAPVDAREDLPGGGEGAWLEGEVVSLSPFVVRLSYDRNLDDDAEDPDDVFDVTVTGATLPAWVVAGGTVVVFGVLSADQATLAIDGGVYRDHNEMWGDTVLPPLQAASVGLTGRATFNGRSGRVATRTDANGDTTSYEYDALGRLSKWKAADGGQVSYAYAPTDNAYAHATAHHSDEFNPGDTIDTVTFVDGIGRITQQKQETAVFQGVGQPPRNGFYVSGSLLYDALGRVVEETLPNLEDHATASTFRARDAAQPSTKRVYDKLDRLRQETLPDGRVTTTAYTFVPFSGTTASSMEYTDPMGRSTTTFSDVRGYPRASDDTAIGKAPLRTSYTNDLLGQLQSVSAAGRTQVANTYDLLGRRTSTDTEDTGRVDFAYDAVGNKVSSQSAVQRAAAGSRTTYRYSFGRLVAIDHPPTTPDVALTWGGYNGAPRTDHGAGRLVGVRDAARTQTLGYDANGRVDAETTAMVGADWKMGQLTTSWDFDWLGRTATTTYPDTETVTQDFDLGGQLSSVSGQKVCNEIGRLAAAVDAVQTTVTVAEFPNTGPPALPFVITVDGEQMRVTDRVATAVPGVFAYTVERGINGTPELPTATAHSSGAKVVTDVQLTCTYRYVDDRQYDLYGAPAFQQVGNGNRTQYQRDPLNRRLTRQVTTAPAQGRASAGTLNAAVTSSATTLVVKELYAPPVLPFTAVIGTERVLVTARAPTGTTGQFSWTVQRGTDGTTAAAQASGATVSVDRVQQNLTYTYDPAGNVKSYVDDLPPDVPSLFGGKVSQTYDYDGYYRLKGSTGTWNEAQNTRFYEYAVGWDDATGNLTSKHQKAWEVKVGCRRNCIDVIEDLTYDFTDVAYAPGNQHRLATQGGETFTYDLDGNITAISSPDNLREMSWNDDGRMTMIVDRPNGSGGKPTHITYDYTGQVAKEDKEQGRSWFVNPWVTVKDGTVWKNVFAGGERLGVKFSQGGYENRPYWFHKDLQGSTNVVTDRVAGLFQHQQYLPTGEPWIDEDSTVLRTPYQFSGEYVDEDHDLADFGNRWYEPAGQFFYSADPAVIDDLTAALEQPGLLSVYTLGFGNAVSNVDPDGRKPFQVTALRQTALLNDLRTAGVDSTRWPDQQATQAIADFFQRHDGLGGQVAYGLVQGLAKLQAFANSLEQKPVLEFEFQRDDKSLRSKHQLSSVKLGFGVGPRKKFEVGASQPPPRPANPVPAPPQAQPPPRPGVPAPAAPQPANAGGGQAAVPAVAAPVPRAPVAASRARASSAPPIMGRSGGGNRGV